MQSEWMLVAVSIIIRRRTPVFGRVSAGPIAMQKTLLQYLIETFLEYNDVANQRKKHFHQL